MQIFLENSGKTIAENYCAPRNLGKKGIYKMKMKRKISALLFLCISAFAFCKSQKEIKQPQELEEIIEQHPLVEKAEIYEVYYHSLLKVIFYKSRGEEPKCSYSFDLDLTLTNGHEITFKMIKSDLTFGKWGSIHHVNKVYFCSADNKDNSQNGIIKFKDLCKATDINYFNLYSVLDNYKDFCKLLNSIPYVLDKNAEKLCAKYSYRDYVDLYRFNDAFIEIPIE